MAIRIYSSGRTKKSGYRFFEVDLHDLGTPDKSANHLAYKCPWCSDGLKGKKLYYDTKKAIGFCYRCETVVFIHGSKAVSKSVIDEFSWINYFKTEEQYYDISWSQPADSNTVSLNYLLNRKVSYGSDIIDKYNIRAFEVGNSTCLILPNDYPERNLVDSFQTSLTERREGVPKYVTYSSDKSIYFLKMRSQDKKLILVEGVFDAIASNGCALLGKTLSTSQQRQFYNHIKNQNILKEVFICLDGEVAAERKIRTGHQVLGVNSSLKVYYVNLPDNLDPEEAVAEGVFEECLNKAKKVFR
jgi:hypothetical protein